jgi:hypothetical protein
LSLRPILSILKVDGSGGIHAAEASENQDQAERNSPGSVNEGVKQKSIKTTGSDPGSRRNDMAEKTAADKQRRKG